MNERLKYISEQIKDKNPLHYKSLISNLNQQDSEYFDQADSFFNKYEKFLQINNKSWEYAIGCYLEMVQDVVFETIRFKQTKEYSSKSFNEVNKRVYANPEIMEYYMHGLLLSQFLWIHHYKVLLYFDKVIEKNSTAISNYLEIGGGHGLYLEKAISLVDKRKACFDLIDISETSIEIAKALNTNNIVNYIHCDIFKFQTDTKYDFITMGEILEHVENPIHLLKQVSTFLKDDGKIFLTTPTNAPAIDHIYLFRNAEEIRRVINEAGLKIEEENCISVDEKTKNVDETIIYAAVLKSNKK